MRYGNESQKNVFNQISIAAQIIDGSIKIDSRAEFENVLRLFPNDPALLRAYADLLLSKKSPEVAAQSYAEAAGLFIDSGMTLQAIVAKSLEWKINPPTDPEQIREFFTLMNENGYHRTPVNDLFHTLSYSALVAVLYPLIKIRLPAGRMVKKVGDEEKNLMKVCVKYPEVEEALGRLFTSHSGIEEKDNSLVNRMGSRQQVPVKVHLQVQSSNNGNPPLVLTGYSKDISIGGICVVLDAEHRDHPLLNQAIKNAHVQISLPSEDFTINVPGKIIWNRRIDIEQDTALALGMQYREMSPKSRGMLLGFANSLKVN